MIKKMTIQDHPNARSAHLVATPTGGGLAIVGSFYLGLVLFYLMGLVSLPLFYALLMGLLLAGVGFVDDVVELSPTFRIIIQIFVVGMAIYLLGLVDLYPWWMLFLFLLASLWLINLYNFMDGIDGYAASEGIIVSLGAYVLYHDSVFMIMMAAIAGFLYFNWQKASLFMGDVGSTFLGFFFAVMALGHYHDSEDIMIWMILLGVFIFDATMTLFRRMNKGKKISQAHQKHAFQRLVKSGFSHQKVVLLAMTINVLMLTILIQFGVSWLVVLGYHVLLYILLKMIDKRRSF